MSAKPQSQPKAATISKEVAEKIKTAQLANIIRKVKAGKSLSAAESKMLDAAASPEDQREFVTVSKIAEAFQVSRKTIYQWRKEGRDVPESVDKKEDIAAWRAWFNANPSAGHYDGKPRRDRETLLCEKLEIEIDLKRIDREQQLGNLIEVGKVREAAMKIVSAARGEFLKATADLPPRLEGLTASKCQKILREAVTAILSRLADETSELYKEENE